MKVRKLEKREHQKTRNLWELVFAEDTNSFLDYYYTEKTSQNDMYVMEDGSKMVGMLQLNPYIIKMGNIEFLGHYIIAVATHPDYRKQGAMRGLLNQSLKDMYEEGEAFTFLMPAVEAIYLPFDFRYVYTQRNGNVKNYPASVKQTATRNATPADCQMLAEFANKYLNEFDVYAKRTKQYYECLIKELQSEGGNIAIVENDNQMLGFYLYTNAKEYIIREPLFAENNEEYLVESLDALTKGEESKVKCIAYDGTMEDVEEKPIIMLRILHPEIIFKQLRTKQKMNLCVEIVDDIIEENNKKWRLSACEGEFLEVLECDDEADVKLSIAELVTELFGDKNNKKLTGIKSMNKIFLNEIV